MPKHTHTHTHTHTYIYIYIYCDHVYIYIYIYIYRERERERGDRNKWENYGGITPLICLYNVMSSIVRNRLYEYKEKIIGYYQNVFRPNRGAMDDIHIIIIIISIQP
jgi:hypothetical protein